MVKRSKKVWTAVITALFVLSISYFALLAPTTAWYYQEYETQHLFKFGDFSVEKDNDSPQVWDGVQWSALTNAVVKLRAATRFADPGEYLFSEVAHTVKVVTINQGNVPADVNVTVTGLPTWMHYYVFGAAEGATIAEPNLTASSESGKKGTFKSQIESTVYTGALPAYTTEQAYATVYATAKSNLDDHNAEPVRLEPYGVTGSTKDIYIIFWAEYGEVLSAAPGFTSVNSTSTPVVNLDNNGAGYAVDIEMTATPYVPTQQTVTIRNDGSNSATLSISWDGAAPVTQTVAAGSSVEIVKNINVQYAIQLTNAASASLAFDETNSSGTVANGRMTGFVTNQGATIVICDETAP